MDHALRDGWGLGDLPQLVAEIGTHADQLDAQLGLYAQHSRVSAYVDHASLGRLREHHAKSDHCPAPGSARPAQRPMRTPAASDIQSRTDLEIEARRRLPIPGPIDELKLHHGQPIPPGATR